jgi:hypothetical protein
LDRNQGRLTRESTDDPDRLHDWSLSGRSEKTQSTFHVGTSDYAFTITSTVDALGRPQERIYPDGDRLQFTHAGGTNTQVSLLRSGASLATTLFSGIQAHPSGGLERITHAGPGIPVVRTYPDEKAQRLGSIAVGSGANVLQDLGFEYDRAGNLLAIATSGGTASEQQFWYDGEHRLTKSVDWRSLAQGGYGTIECVLPASVHEVLTRAA